MKAAQMFCEIALGQLLGPNPGVQPGPGRSKKNDPHADCLIPAQRVNELRRYHGWADSLMEEVRNGALSRRALLLKVDRWEAAGREEPTEEDVDIRDGDFREVLSEVEPGSVALVLTDRNGWECGQRLHEKNLGQLAPGFLGLNSFRANWP